MADHGGALDYDLMTMTRYTLDDVGGRLRVRSLAHFVRHLPPTSALMREMPGGLDAEQAAWARGDVTTQLLALIADEVRGMEWLFQCAHSRARARRPRRLVTPWTPDEELGVRRIGREAVRVADFDDWWEGKAKGA